MTKKLFEVVPTPGMSRVERAVTLTDILGVTHEAFVPDCVLFQDENGRSFLQGFVDKDGVITLHFPDSTLNTGVNFVQVREVNEKGAETAPLQD